MEVPVGGWFGNPSALYGGISDIPSQDKGKSDRDRKYDQVEECQTRNPQARSRDSGGKLRLCLHKRSRNYLVKRKWRWRDNSISTNYLNQYLVKHFDGSAG